MSAACVCLWPHSHSHHFTPHGWARPPCLQAVLCAAVLQSAASVRALARDGGWQVHALAMQAHSILVGVRLPAFGPVHRHAGRVTPCVLIAAMHVSADACACAAMHVSGLASACYVAAQPHSARLVGKPSCACIKLVLRRAHAAKAARASARAYRRVGLSCSSAPCHCFCYPPFPSVSLPCLCGQLRWPLPCGAAAACAKGRSWTLGFVQVPCHRHWLSEASTRPA